MANIMIFECTKIPLPDSADSKIALDPAQFVIFCRSEKHNETASQLASRHHSRRFILWKNICPQNVQGQNFGGLKGPL